MLPDELQRIPIACRIVASDQWLLTHFDATWKVAELKQYILSKVNGRDSGGQQYFPPRNRPVSPITFASSGPSRYSFDRPKDGQDDSDDDEDNDDDVFPVDGKHMRPKPVWGDDRDRGHSPSPTSHHSLIAFSTGQLLEDDYSLSWYRLQPNELLELHPPGTIINLVRDDASEYIQPYLEVKVKALRVISHEETKPKIDGTKIRHPRDNGQPRSPTERSGQSLRKRKKTKLEWKERWLIVHQGMLKLFKDKSDTMPTHSCSLDLLSTLSRPESVLHGSADALSSPHIICAKFRSPLSQEPLSPSTEAWNDPWSGSPIKWETEQGPNGPGGNLARGSREDFKMRKGSGGGAARTTDGTTETKENSSFWYNVDSDPDGTWLILDVLEFNAKSDLLRILHRHHPHNITSTFVPGDAPSSSLLNPPHTAEAVQGNLPRSPCLYPEWRWDISTRAQRAGLGEVGRAMSWLMWRDTGQETTPPTLTPNEPSLSSLEFDIDPLADTHEVELEWDDWIKDLPRQCRVAALAEPATPRPFDASGSDVSPDTRPWHRHADCSPGHDPTALPTPLYDCDMQGMPPHLRGPFQDALSADGPALLTTPSIFPILTSGTTTSVVSAGGVVRAHSRTAVNQDGRGRGVPRSMEVVQEGIVSPSKDKGKNKEKRRRKERDDERSQVSSFASSYSYISAPDVVLPARDGSLDRPSSAKSRSTNGLARKASASSKVSSATATSSGSPNVSFGPNNSGTASDNVSASVHTSTETTSTISTPDVATTTESTITATVEATGSKSSAKSRQKKEGFRFKPDRLVKGLDSALDFVDGR